MGEQITVTILNWDKYNPRKDVKQSSWFRFEHDYFDSAQFFDFTHTETVCWLYLKCQASKAKAEENRGRILINKEHLEKIGKVKFRDLRTTLDKLKRNGIVDVTCAPVDDTRTYSTRRDETGRNETGREPVDSTSTHPLIKVWNENCGKLPKVKAANTERLRHIKARWSENSDPEYWTEVTKKLAGSDFCNGLNFRGWRASFDFMLKPETQNKALEGTYDKANGQLDDIGDLGFEKEATA